MTCQEAQGAATFSILEPLLTVAVSTAVSSLTEGNEAAFTVTASKAPAADLTVNPVVYGFPSYNNQLTFTPTVAIALSPTSRTYGPLWSVAPYSGQPHALPWEFSIEVERLEYFSSSTPADHSLKLKLLLILLKRGKTLPAKQAFSSEKRAKETLNKSPWGSDEFWETL